MKQLLCNKINVFSAMCVVFVLHGILIHAEVHNCKDITGRKSSFSASFSSYEGKPCKAGKTYVQGFSDGVCKREKNNGTNNNYRRWTGIGFVDDCTVGDGFINCEDAVRSRYYCAHDEDSIEQNEQLQKCENDFNTEECRNFAQNLRCKSLCYCQGNDLDCMKTCAQGECASSTAHQLLAKLRE